VTSYKREQSVQRWTPTRFTDDGVEYPADVTNPTPNVTEIRGWSVWGDIDLADAVKPKRGKLPVQQREVIETALEKYCGKIGKEFYGDRDAVFLLDSVGGAYVMGPPAATIPIVEHLVLGAEEYPAEDLERIFKHFRDETNAVLKEIESAVNSEIKEASDLLDPDWVNNLNRQYKAPLSVHTSHPAVVTPLDPGDVDYDPLHIEDVTDEHIKEAEQRACELTDPAHAEYVENVVKTICPAAYGDADGDWKRALDVWLARQRAEDEAKGLGSSGTGDDSQDWSETIGASRGVMFTSDQSNVLKATNHLDIEEIADRTIVHKWTDNATSYTDNSGENKRAFIPTWGRNANTGNANFVNTKQGIWVDSGEGNQGGPVKLALIDDEGWPRDQYPDGEDWHQGVELLREMGYEEQIPYWIPGEGSEKPGSDEEYEQTPNNKLILAAKKLDLVSDEELIEKESKYNDGTYKRLPTDVYWDVVNILEDEYDISTGRLPEE